MSSSYSPSHLPFSHLSVFQVPFASLSHTSPQLARTPLASLPLASLSIVSLPLASCPLSNGPLFSLPHNSHPLARPPIASPQLASLPLASLLFFSLPLVSLPSIGLSPASFPLQEAAVFVQISAWTTICRAYLSLYGFPITVKSLLVLTNPEFPLIPSESS